MFIVYFSGSPTEDWDSELYWELTASSKIPSRT